MSGTVVSNLQRNQCDNQPRAKRTEPAAEVDGRAANEGESKKAERGKEQE